MNRGVPCWNGTPQIESLGQDSSILVFCAGYRCFESATILIVAAIFIVANIYGGGMLLAMHHKAEELLYSLLWTCDMFARPTFRNVTDSFEGWAYRNGLLREMQRLEKQHWVEQQVTPAGDRLHRLTEAGRLHALGGREPMACWNRPWDRRWRLVLFDVPENRSTMRDRLRRLLQARGFGYLQHSVWITPHPVMEERALLAGCPADVGALILMEAYPCAGETEQAIVAGAWDFAAINRLYAIHRQILEARPIGRLTTEIAASFQRWLEQERVTWLEALQCDPLLPEVLLPADYGGRKAWQRRLEVMAAAAEQMRGFHGVERARQ